MSDPRRAIGDLLGDRALYEDASQQRPADDWRRRLLATRFPSQKSARSSRRPVAGLPPIMRLILMVALPVAVLVMVGLGAMVDFELPFNVPAIAPPSEIVEMPEFSLPGVSAFDGMSRSLHEHGRVLGLFGFLIMVACSAFLTYFVRGRLPQLLPMDW